MIRGPRPDGSARLVRLIGLVLLLGATLPARAATDLYMDGYFRLRARLFDNLSLKRDVPLSDSSDPALAGSTGTASYFEQRLRISPELRINQYLSVFAQIDVLPDLVWGTSPERLALDGYFQSIGQSQSFNLPGDVPLIAPRRAWAEIYTPVGRLKIGRTAQQVGAGIYFNDGNALDADYGDTADRIQFLTRFSNIYALLGYDMIYQGSLDRPYHAQAVAAAVAYRSELLSGSFYAYLVNDRSWEDEGKINADTSTRNKMLTSTFDLWGKATVGPVDLEAEAIYRYGTGQMVLDSVEAGKEPKTFSDASISQFGAMLRGSYGMKTGKLGAEAGVASGDPDSLASSASLSSTSYSKFTRFTFDRDYHIAFLMFRQPMPQRASRASDTSYSDVTDTAIVGQGVSNAFYVVPSIEWNALDKLTAKLSAVGAWALEAPPEFNGNKDYGYEVDLDLKSQLFEKLYLGGTAAIFFPGKIFQNNREFAFGGQVLVGVQF